MFELNSKIFKCLSFLKFIFDQSSALASRVESIDPPNVLDFGHGHVSLPRVPARGPCDA